MDLTMDRGKIRKKYKKYLKLMKKGKTPQDIYVQTKSDGVGTVDRIKILWYICDLSPHNAKELMIVTNTNCHSIDEYQGKYIYPVLRELFDKENQEPEKK